MTNQKEESIGVYASWSDQNLEKAELFETTIFRNNNVIVQRLWCDMSTFEQEWRDTDIESDL